MKYFQDGISIVSDHSYLLDFLWFLSLWLYSEGIIGRNLIGVQIHNNELH